MPVRTQERSHDTTNVNLPLHCHECQCTPKFNQCAVLYRHKNDKTRLMIEASYIDNSGSECMSQPSISFHKDKIKCLNSSPCVPD
uniref:Tick transposon n=1 Tax=Rhipicephalus appendiculatus TaxID=34631 RepID=A0A131YKR5_RHIAP